MKKAVRLFGLIGEVDERYIDDMLRSKTAPVSWQARWRRVAAIAACVVLVLGLGVGGYAYQQATRVVYPTENASYALVSGPFSASEILDYTAFSREASVIVCADVQDIHMERREHRVNGDGDPYDVRIAAVSVRSVIKGDVHEGDTLYVRSRAFGYYTDHGVYRETLALDAGPLLEKGNRVLLFLYKGLYVFTTTDGNELYEIAGDGLARFFYDEDGLYHAAATYENGFLESLSADAAQSYRPRSEKQIASLTADIPTAQAERFPLSLSAVEEHYDRLLQEHADVSYSAALSISITCPVTDELLDILRFDEWQICDVDPDSEEYKEQYYYRQVIQYDEDSSVVLYIGDTYGAIERRARVIEPLFFEGIGIGDVCVESICFKLPQESPQEIVQALTACAEHE